MEIFDFIDLDSVLRGQRNLLDISTQHNQVFEQELFGVSSVSTE